jgi:hypothetical protein
MLTSEFVFGMSGSRTDKRISIVRTPMIGYTTRQDAIAISLHRRRLPSSSPESD